MNQIKFRESGDRFWIGMKHTEHKSKSKHDYEIPLGSSYLSGKIAKDAYILKKIHLSSLYNKKDLKQALFRALYEMSTSNLKKIVSTGVLAPSERKSLEREILSYRRRAREDLPQENRFQITRGKMMLLRRFSGILEQCLREPADQQTGDPGWSVGSGGGFSSWRINHPDLSMIESGKSPLYLSIKEGENGSWLVIGHNQVENLFNHKVLSVQQSPPDQTWDINNIAKTAAAYFQEQKQKIMGLKQTMTPPPSATEMAPAPQPPGGGPGGGMPMASRSSLGLDRDKLTTPKHASRVASALSSRRVSATLKNLARAREIVARIDRSWRGRQAGYGGSQVINDRDGIGIRVQLVGRPTGRLAGSLGGVPVEWVDGQGRRVRANWGGAGYFIRPDGQAIDAGDNHILFMRDNPEIFGGANDPEEMVGRGWIRARGYSGRFSIDAGGGMNDRQLSSLKKIILQECRYSDPVIEVSVDYHDIYELSCDEFDEIEYPNQVKRGRKIAHKMKSRWAADLFDESSLNIDPEEQEKKDHEDRVRQVYKHLLEHRRSYSSVKYLAHVLEMDPHKLARALGELIAQGKIDILNKKFKPVPPQKDNIERVSLTATTSKFRTDQGNWRHDDQLQTQSTTQFEIFDAPEEDRVDHESRVMPDPVAPN